MISVQVSENETIDKALKRFKKKLEKRGILKEYRNRRFYVKQSVERRAEIGKAVYRQWHVAQENK